MVASSMWGTVPALRGKPNMSIGQSISESHLPKGSDNKFIHLQDAFCNESQLNSQKDQTASFDLNADLSSEDTINVRFLRAVMGSTPVANHRFVAKAFSLIRSNICDPRDVRPPLLIVHSSVERLFLIQDPVTVLGVLYYGKLFVRKMPETTLGKMWAKQLGKQVGQKKEAQNPGKHWEILFLKCSPNHQI